ncbi:TPA_asm: superinfection exclusion protein [Salmonella enterica subsp. enterica]|uniref:Superinfection exclusion protein n=1 Tax=Salmonella enterica I TaxID=59201 RepID=A0A6X7VYB6_SALET|nr:superinfection exclusion protein [Salmonella enterica]HAB1652877.1 superinfection exclusion protein [Salmonella enterica subsp. enterica]EHW1979648.1 superinfection exclusion protein [Salmonella enterica subsp. enterica serovar Agona]MDQ7373434.1 superinfection exclusion protein [Salmonella enterica subsp. enterica serovar Agona]MDQ7396249.1 superinfection exclusion protein [Salmonella enterica subsp. enterica serovar Agona]MDQ7558069.1 superinfection exclusion protein [Salmonella enterica 
MKLRVWHIPQVPMKPFIVEVASVEKGVRVMDALADYDAFQYDNNIKPDYCNANGLEMWDESLTDQDLEEMELTDRWVDWYSECQCYDDPREYIESLKEETTTAA